MNVTVDAIYEIILKEEENDPSLIRQDFVINITGSTNAMGAGALLCAVIVLGILIRQDLLDEKYPLALIMRRIR